MGVALDTREVREMSAFSQIQPVPRAWIFTDEELVSIYTVLAGIPDTDEKYGDPAFLARVALGAGLRRSEFWGLTVDDITKDHCWIHIRNGKGSKPRDVRVTPELVPWIELRLKTYRVQSTGFLFPPQPGQEKIGDGRETLRLWWHRILSKVRMGSGWKLTHHNLHHARHTYASWELAMERLSITDLAANLGHSSVDITSRYYLHMVRELVYAKNKRAAWCDVAMGKYLRRDHACRGCNKDFDRQFRFCPHCGTERA